MKLLIASAFVLASPAMAQTATAEQPATTASQPAPAKVESERKICRNDPRSETRISKKICKTAAEWHEQSRSTNGGINTLRDN